MTRNYTYHCVQQAGASILALHCGIMGCGAAATTTPDAASVGVTLNPFELRLTPMLLSEVSSASSEAASRSITAETTIVNTSQQDVSVRLDSMSCSCLTVALSHAPLKPGASFTIAPGHLKSLSLGIRPPAEVGEHAFNCGLSIPDNSDTQSSLMFKAVLPVYNDIELLPPVLRIPLSPTALDVPQKRSVQCLFRLREKGEMGILSLTTRLLPPGIVVDGIARVAASPIDGHPSILNYAWRIDFSCDGKQVSECDKFPAIVSICEDEQPIAFARLPLQVFVADGVEAPRRVDFHSSHKFPSQRRAVLLRSRDDIPFRVQEVIGNCDAVTASVEVQEDKTVQWLYIVIAPKQEASIESSVSIKTTHPKSPTVEIAVGWAGHE